MYGFLTCKHMKICVHVYMHIYIYIHIYLYMYRLVQHMYALRVVCSCCWFFRTATYCRISSQLHDSRDSAMLEVGNSKLMNPCRLKHQLSTVVHLTLFVTMQRHCFAQGVSKWQISCVWQPLSESRQLKGTAAILGLEHTGIPLPKTED